MVASTAIRSTWLVGAFLVCAVTARRSLSIPANAQRGATGTGRRRRQAAWDSKILRELRGGSDYGGYDGGNYRYNDPGDDDDEDAYGRQPPSSQQGSYGDFDGRNDPADRSKRSPGNDYYDGDYYDDRGSSRGDRRRQGNAAAAASNVLKSMPGIIRNGDRRIGLALLGSGTIVTMAGVALFFQKTLMRLGNLLVIAGIPMTIGPSRTVGYFVRPEKFRATACLAFGIFLVFVGWPIFGIAFEVFGLLNLFGNMFPMVMAIAKNMPVIGPLLSGGARGNNNRSNGRRRPADDDYYYDDQQGDRGSSRGYYDDQPSSHGYEDQDGDAGSYY